MALIIEIEYFKKSCLYARLHSACLLVAPHLKFIADRRE